jgi:hypothetical protein
VRSTAVIVIDEDLDDVLAESLAATFPRSKPGVALSSHLRTSPTNGSETSSPGAVDQARLENEAGDGHRATLKRVDTYAISALSSSNYHVMSVVNLDVLRGSKPHLSQSCHNRVAHLPRFLVLLVGFDGSLASAL